MRRWGGLLGGPGNLTATVILAFALAISLVGGLTTRQDIKNAFDRERRLLSGQLALQQLLTLQLDEETAVRGYTSTLDRTYLEPYYAAESQFDAVEGSLRQELRNEGLGDASVILADFDRVHAEWHRSVANALLRAPRSRNAAEIQKNGKALIDTQRSDAAALQSLLSQRHPTLSQQSQDAVNRSFLLRALTLAIFGVLAIVFNIVRSRVNRELEREKTTTETLQRAFMSESAPLPNCRIGHAYASATKNAAIGGDIFDVYQLTPNKGLILIADVSGKGIDAAVLTAFIKFTIRAIAVRQTDPAGILSEFNLAFPRAVNNADLFVSMFVGLLDTSSGLLQYASGGHDSTFVRQGADVQLLPVTGPIIGVMQEPYVTRSLVLDSRTLLVLATDGLTESRDVRGAFLQDFGAMRLIAQGSEEPQALADELIAKLQARGGGRLGDDIAILVVKFLTPVQQAHDTKSA